MVKNFVERRDSDRIAYAEEMHLERTVEQIYALKDDVDFERLCKRATSQPPQEPSRYEL